MERAVGVAGKKSPKASKKKPRAGEKRLKVLMVNALFHPFKGGVEKHLLELSRELVRQGVEVHVLTGRLQGTKARETLFGIKVHRVACTEVRLPNFYPPPVILAPEVFSAIKELDRKENFDLVHLQDRWFPDFAHALTYAKTVGKPFVVTLHNARPVGIAPHYTLLGGAYDSLVGKPVLENADLIISVSEWAMHDISKYGIPLQKMVCVHNGIFPSEYGPSAARALRFRKKMGFSQGEKILLFVGRIIRQKGIDYLLQAMPLVLKKIPGARLVLVGRGTELEQKKNLVRKMGLEQKVFFPGFVDEAGLKDALAACDVFVLPSLWEVLPVSILEAMAFAKPVVAADVGGDYELVRNGFNGFLVPRKDSRQLAQKLVKVLSDEKLRRRMGANSRKWVEEEFDWKLIARQTIGLYRRLLEWYAREGPGPVPLPVRLLSMGEELKHRAKIKYGRKVEGALRKYGEDFNEGFENLVENFSKKFAKRGKTS